MVDNRVKPRVRPESVLISIIGTVTGMALRIFMGAALILSTERLSDADISLSFAPGLPTVGVVLGDVLGFLASLIPAHRSTRLEVPDAIQAV